MTLAAIETRTVPLDRCIKVTGMTGRSAGDPVRVAGGVVVRGELFERLNRAGRERQVGAAAVVDR